tara:strand:- start:88 stop:381 length:294 start_codon:yes stop_codon:yes gene_type:complete
MGLLSSLFNRFSQTYRSFKAFDLAKLGIKETVDNDMPEERDFLLSRSLIVPAATTVPRYSLFHKGPREPPLEVRIEHYVFTSKGSKAYDKLQRLVGF